MPIPLTRSCPQCEAEMELVTTDDDGEIVVYECPDCGAQVETPVEDEQPEDDRDSADPGRAGGDEPGSFEPDDLS